MRRPDPKRRKNEKKMNRALQTITKAERAARYAEWADLAADEIAARQAEAEASDAGRAPRFPSGWWIVPAIILGGSAWAALVWRWLA